MRPKDDQINALRDIASALEHSKDGGESLTAIFCDVLRQVDGKTCSIGPVLKSAVDF